MLTLNVNSKHGTIIPTGITCKKILLQKSSELSMALKYSAARYKQIAEIFQLAENLVLGL